MRAATATSRDANTRSDLAAIASRSRSAWRSSSSAFDSGVAIGPRPSISQASRTRAGDAAASTLAIAAPSEWPSTVKVSQPSASAAPSTSPR